ncbi:ankyrin repeat-containing protein BDA1-like isoform X2 [Humulus lupulus]|uniref:ankyrin repeat-containing protein BDA1-like isoform X2 n=1 Tax=Humulus lupulus TaxID=3486 RepID=UPI002B410482|nr:ankyrin repeat-containing protein BDA1-like isoform X2 [Humulus lupulus]
METMLLNAVNNGEVSTLEDLLQEDPLLLDRVLVSCFTESPLHVALMLGHLDLAWELLRRKPEMASELDSTGSSPLHLAAAKGHVEIVKELLAVDPEAWSVRNQDGRTPLHVAAFKGRVKVLSELVRVMPESVRALTDRGETAMHLCVVKNRLEGLRVLVEGIGRHSEIVSWKDFDGFTVLHIAVARKQFEIIKFLLSSTGVDVNALNTNGSTALDILLQSPRDLRDIEIEDSLRAYGARIAKDIPSIVQNWKSPIERRITKSSASSINLKGQSFNKQPMKHKHTDWLGRKRSALMVVASLIATVAFQASITPPGGVWQDTLRGSSNSTDSDKPHEVGKSIMASSDDSEYGLFMIFNTLAFLSSLSIILLIVSGLPIKRRRWMWIQMVIMWIAITAQVVTYFIALRHMSPKNDNVQEICC